MSGTGIIRKAWDSVRPRMTPSLIILGAQKAGTSTLFDMLKRHPCILAPRTKEIHYFDRDTEYAKGSDHYRSHFPVKPFRVSGYITLEATPSYLFHSMKCAPRIARDLPRATCLIMLRDPVKRAYSAWNMCRTFGERPHPLGIPDHRSFQQAVEDELAGRTPHDQHKYLARGMYARQVKDYRDRLGPMRLLVHTFLRLKREPALLLNEVLQRVGLEEMKAGHEVFGTHSNEREYISEMDPGLKRVLYKYFEPEMEKLPELLGHGIDIMEE